ncbi:M15 family metallopeptidase [Neisseria lisongii]|uniref:M15 family metallopeptidase n=1 Tax=Neisseria lisongii TaxID=2912188 RepID=A0AAW5APX0_9NEIS|nr:M15 family metallopeptidase [Neisseria lisongii]MCF7530237.1 M15 family metallopeptidase [Neisseria lisongii]
MKFLLKLLVVAALAAAGFFAYQMYQDNQRRQQEWLELREQELSQKERALNQSQEEARIRQKLEQDLSEKQADMDTVPSFGTSGSLVSGQVVAERDRRFKRLPSEFSTKSIYVNVETYHDLVKMMSAARSDGIDLKVMSGFRSYDYQKGIWDRKWQAFGAGVDERTRINSIMRYSSLPGISRHHWGTDVDFNSVSSDYWQSAKGRKIYQWLKQNAPAYGFCQVYDGKSRGERQGGYEDEPWHWSYLKVAAKLQREREATIDELVGAPIYGRETLRKMIPQLKTYVTSIHPSCR